MARLLAFLALKGGAGKSTCCLHVAAALHRRGHQVVVLEADAQGTLSEWAAAGRLPFQVVPFDLARPVRTVVADLKAHTDTGVQVVLLDCAPHLQEPAVTAALLADVVVVPVQPSPLDVAATGPTLELVREARKARQGGRPKLALVPYRMTHTQLSARLPATLADLGELVAPGVGQRTAVAECGAVGLTVDAYEPKNPAVAEFDSLAAFLLKLAN